MGIDILWKRKKIYDRCKELVYTFHFSGHATSKLPWFLSSVKLKVTGYTFKSHYDCAIAGYLVSADHYKNLVDDEYYGLDRLNNDKIAIKFECRELPTA